MKGVLTYLPYYDFFIMKRKRLSKHSNANALFCYSYWLGLLQLFDDVGINADTSRVCEVGAGGSIGVGICALLTGSKEYYALEIENLYNVKTNLRLFDEIVELLLAETPLSTDFGQINFPIRSSNFPYSLIKPAYLDTYYVQYLRQCVAKASFQTGEIVHLIHDWENSQINNIGFFFSRAVMEHVNKPESVYKSIARFLTFDGIMLHDIELHSHGITNDRFGHMKLEGHIWKLIRGRRKYLLNKYSYARHLTCIENGFTILFDSVGDTIRNKVNGTVQEPEGVCFVAKKR